MTRRRRPVGRPGSVAVIIPAHNEEGLLPASLAAVHTAAGHPGLEGTRVLVVVAADSCTDATPEVARRAGALTVAVRGRGAGAARAAAARAALGVLGGGDGVWIASTDADSVVPADWLDFHLSYAARGWDALVGTVVLDRHPADARRLTAVHHRLYEKSRPPGGLPWHHPHVHGANLGLTARSYTHAGGFPPLSVGEDHALVRALQRTGHRILRTPDCPVTTSGRLHPRARGGFGEYLARLAAQETA
ncbi:glycosyltransferase [Streptomyces sp. NPDC006333]|uniref:glycosyltransferase n=1 Tax=Streptomyces sp. NPDC006333 TaxID=3156753 RepID=UPI0033AF8B69